MARKKAARKKPIKKRATRPKTKPKHLKRSLNRNEYVVVRNAKGQYRKHRKDLKVILEVRNKKTGKVVGYINQVKDGKPVARRFSGSQFTLLTKPKVEPGFEVKEKGETFRVYSNAPIVHQIPGQLPSQVKRLARASAHGSVIVGFEVFYKRDFHLFTTATVFDGTEKTSDMRMAMAKMIIDALYSINVRISPKAVTNRQKNKLRRYVDVTPQFT